MNLSLAFFKKHIGLLIFFLNSYMAFTQDILDESSYVEFSFDNTDIKTIVRIVAGYTGKKIIISDKVAGKITIIAPRVKREEVLKLFVGILETSGYSLIEEEGYMRIVPAASRTIISAPVIPHGDQLPEHGIYTKIFKIQYVSAANLKAVIENIVGGGKSGAVACVEESNHLIVTDTATSLKRISQLIDQIDQPGLTQVTELVKLNYTDAVQISSSINEAFLERESRAQQLVNRLPPVPGVSVTLEGRYPPRVIPVPESNSLILAGSRNQIEMIKELISKLDVENFGASRLNVIFLKYISAEETAKKINSLVGNKTDKDAGGKKSEIFVEASSDSNALFVKASPSDFAMIRDFVEKLDREPLQVHIEVLIAEVFSSEATNLGVSIASLQLPSKAGETVIQGSSLPMNEVSSLVDVIQKGFFPQGLSIRALHGLKSGENGKLETAIPAIANIRALAETGKIKIRSRTSVGTQDNKEAIINIVNDIPVLKSTIQGGSGTARDVIQNIDRIEVGIKLKLIPHVIDFKKVRMELAPSIEAVISSAGEGDNLTPVIARRQVQTTVTVDDGNTIVIAGLTREDNKKTIQKIPILGSIPILGWLFRYKQETLEKTDLLIYVTPHILLNELNEGEKTFRDS